MFVRHDGSEFLYNLFHLEEITTGFPTSVFPYSPAQCLFSLHAPLKWSEQAAWLYKTCYQEQSVTRCLSFTFPITQLVTNALFCITTCLSHDMKMVDWNVFTIDPDCTGATSSLTIRSNSILPITVTANGPSFQWTTLRLYTIYWITSNHK